MVCLTCGTALGDTHPVGCRRDGGATAPATSSLSDTHPVDGGATALATPFLSDTHPVGCRREERATGSPPVDWVTTGTVEVPVRGGPRRRCRDGQDSRRPAFAVEELEFASNHVHTPLGDPETEPATVF